MLFSCKRTTNIDEMKITQDSDKFEIAYKPNTATFSGHQLKFIPLDPNFAPTNSQQEKGITYLAELYPDKEIKSTLKKEIEFVDPGQGLETVTCNYCGQLVGFGFWTEQMDNAYKGKFVDLEMVTPCCNKTTSLDQLSYYLPSGFSKFQIMVMDPDIDEETADNLNSDLEAIYGTEIRTIWANY